MPSGVASVSRLKLGNLQPAHQGPHTDSRRLGSFVKVALSQQGRDGLPCLRPSMDLCAAMCCPCQHPLVGTIIANPSLLAELDRNCLAFQLDKSDPCRVANSPHRRLSYDDAEISKNKPPRP
jgi:hypothetical protein